MTYLLNEILLYLVAAAALGAFVGWLIHRCTCNRDLAQLQERLASTQRELDDKNAKISASANEIAKLQTKFESQSDELELMTSRWHGAMSQAKQLPNYQTWVKNLQNMYQKTRGERDKFVDLANHYMFLHADAIQKIKRLNRRVTDQEGYKSRLDDMSAKVRRLNSKVTNSENGMRDLYRMLAQVQYKWREDRSEADLLHQIHSKLEEQRNTAQMQVTELEKNYAEKFQQQQIQHQTQFERLQKRVNELTPLEGDMPGQDTKFNRFMDKIRLMGTSKNMILGRVYKQIEETKLEASEKERVFVDTCEEKDAIIEDLRVQVHTAENRALAASSAVIQKNTARIHELESKLKSTNGSIAMLREHEHTIEALKNKLTQRPARRLPQVTPVKITKPRKTKTKANKPSSKPATGLNVPAKGLNIAVAKVQDDLKLVKGIGPVMEKKLNDFGVYSFEQLARLTDNDIQALAQTLESFPGRIERDKWVSQSRQQFKKKYGKSLD